MYVIKKCENHSYGRNTWKVIHTTKSKEDAIAFCREEYRLLLSCDPNMTSDRIEQYLNSYNVPSDHYWYGTKQFGHNGVMYRAYVSDAAEYRDPVERPDRTELLDKILG